MCILCVCVCISVPYMVPVPYRISHLQTKDVFSLDTSSTVIFKMFFIHCLSTIPCRSDLSQSTELKHHYRQFR